MKNRWATGRSEAFSDGVFSIAVTLLVLDLAVPESAFDHLWRGIAHQWPAYLGYATSFLTLAGIWLAHHGIFRRLQYANNRVMRLNLLLLMAVAFLPFPTRLMAEAIRNTNAERAAAIFYGASLLVLTVVLAALWRAVAHRRDLLMPDVSEEEINAIKRATTPNIGFYVAVIALAIVAPQAAAFGYLLIAITIVTRTRFDHEAISTTTSST